jgi:hypothetical protein
VSPADEDAADAEECVVDVGAAFVAGGEATEHTPRTAEKQKSSTTKSVAELSVAPPGLEPGLS